MIQALENGHFQGRFRPPRAARPPNSADWAVRVDTLPGSRGGLPSDGTHWGGGLPIVLLGLTHCLARMGACDCAIRADTLPGSRGSLPSDGPHWVGVCQLCD